MLPASMPAAVRARALRMLKLPPYMRTHGTGDYFSLNTPMSMYSPLYMNAGQMGLTSDQAGMGGCGCGCGGKCSGGLGAAAATDYGFDSSSGISSMFGIQPFATSYPLIGTTIPNWAWYAVGGLILFSMFGKK